MEAIAIITSGAERALVGKAIEMVLAWAKSPIEMKIDGIICLG